MVLSSILSAALHASRNVAPVPVRAGEAALRRAKHHVTTIMFWAAIILPVCYLALLVGGVGSREEFRLFFQLLGLHMLALLGGRFY